MADHAFVGEDRRDLRFHMEFQLQSIPRVAGIVAAIGFALTAYPIGVERKWVEVSGRGRLSRVELDRWAGLDLASVGNHEFDRGVAHLLRLDGHDDERAAAILRLLSGRSRRMGVVEIAGATSTTLRGAQRTAVAMGLGDPQQALAVAGLPGQVAGEDGLVRTGIAVGEQDRARPGQGQPDAESGHAGRTGGGGQDQDRHCDHSRLASRTRAIRSCAASRAIVGAWSAETSTLTRIDVPSAPGAWSMTWPMKAGPLMADPASAARSIVTVTALPQGASFSAGRPYGHSGWSLRPDEVGGLLLRLPAQSGASHIRLELIAGDGTPLAQSETQVSIAPGPAESATIASVDSAPPGAIVSNPFEQVAAGATTEAVESAPPDEIAKAEPAAPSADSPPLPERKPNRSAGTAPAVRTVKVVTIAPPQPTRPHDGAYALGSPADEAQAPAEWMVTKTAVDMHAKAEQSSETVKVAEGGVKMRVTARDKNWVQVTDPKSSTTGWIYNRFLQPAEPPAH